ncbi:MAG TPA: PspC domain-containing protein [Aldersonia sp.]
MTTNEFTNPIPEQPVKRLTRSRTERMLAGVCGGLAEYTGWDVTLIRLLMVAATVFTGGAAILGYIAAVFIMPDADRVSAP